MEDGGQKGQRDTVPQRHADPQQRQGADLRDAQAGGSGAAGSGSTGPQGASGTQANLSEEPTVAVEEQPDADSNTREQDFASGVGRQLLSDSPRPTRRVTRSATLAVARQSGTAGPSSSGEAARAGSSSQGRAEGSRQQADASKGRRRLPEPDLDAIDDPQERQRQQRLARIRASAAVAREKKRQEMELMGVRADALQAENQRLRLLLAQRDQETMRLRREVGRLREVGNPPQLPPPQLGAPLPDLAAMAAAGFAGAGRAAIPPSAAAYNFPEGAAYGMPEQDMPAMLGAYFFEGGDYTAPLSPWGGSLGRALQQLPPRWAPTVTNVPSRLRQAYPPAVPEPLPQFNPGAPALPGLPLLPPVGPAAYRLDPLFDNPRPPRPAGLAGPAALGLRGALPLGQPVPGPVGQGQAEPSADVVIPQGVIYGVDGQWIRLRPGVNPAPPHSPPPAGRGRGRGSPP